LQLLVRQRCILTLSALYMNSSQLWAALGFDQSVKLTSPIT
jgi:hypothetical protein